jgi:site-specific DNA-adenine methylase
MKNDWWILSKDKLNDKKTDAQRKLLDIMNQIEDGRGWRFTEEQANTLAKLVDNLVKQVKAYNKKRNHNEKRTACFSK